MKRGEVFALHTINFAYFNIGNTNTNEFMQHSEEIMLYKY